MLAISLKKPGTFGELLEFSDDDFTFTGVSGKGFTLVGDDHELVVRGDDITYQNGLPRSGTVERIEFENDDGNDILVINNADFSIASLIAAVQNQDFDALLSTPLSLKGSTGGDVFRSGNGSDDLFGLGGNDTLFGNGGKDSISGAAGNDRLDGGSGNDTLGGSIGNDNLAGGSGKDRLNGAEGDDTLEGGGGVDQLDGGSGSDVFLFRSAAGAKGDTIADFNRRDGADKIDLRQFDADTTTDGRQFFSFVGTDGFSGDAGELRVSGKKIQGDVDGDGTADFTINAKNASLLDADNFLLG